MARNKIIVALSLFLLFVIYLSFIVRIPTAPDEQISILTNKILKDTNTIEFQPPDETATSLGFNSFPDGFNYNEKKRVVVPASFPGFIFISYIFDLAGIPSFYVNPIIATLTLIICFYFIKRIYGTKVAGISTIAIGISPLFLHWAVLNYLDMSSFLVLSMIILVFSKCTKNRTNNLLLGTIISFWILIRYTNAIFLPLLFLYFYSVEKSRRDVLSILTFFIIAMIPILLFNNIYYNAFITVPDTVNTGNEFNYLSLYVVNEDIISSILNRVLVLSTFCIYLFPILFLAFTSLFNMCRIREKSKRNFFIFILSCILIGIIFFDVGSKDFYWKSAHLSFYRYLLPFLVLTSPTIFENLRIKKKFLICIIFLSLVLSLIFINDINYNGAYIRLSKKNSDFIKEKTFSLVPTESVVFTNFYDKIIFPERSIIRLNHDLNKDKILDENIIQLINDLIQNNSLFIMSNDYDQDFNDKIQLIKDNYQIEEIYYNKSDYMAVRLYNITRKNLSI